MSVTADSDGQTAILTSDVRRLHDSDVVVLSGEIDLTSVSHLEEILADLTSQTIVLDLCLVTFMDSVGIHALLNHRRSLEDGRRIQLVVRSESLVARLFELVQLDDMFDTVACDPAHH